MKKLLINFSLIIPALVLTFSSFAQQPQLTLHKRAGCMCCDAHAEILKDEGFEVDVVAHNDLDLFKNTQNISDEFKGCHTITSQNYIIEGHVPGDMIKKLLSEKPDIRGISLPGMPSGTPGMPGPRDHLLDVLVIDDKEDIVYGQF